MNGVDTEGERLVRSHDTSPLTRWFEAARWTGESPQPCGHRHETIDDAGECARKLTVNAALADFDTGGSAGPAFGVLRVDLDAKLDELFAPLWWLNEYETNREYGGPEEGGWYFHSGGFIASHDSPFESREAAEAMRDSPWGLDYLAAKREGQHHPNSVECAGYSVLLVERHPGRSFPVVRPWYA